MKAGNSKKGLLLAFLYTLTQISEYSVTARKTFLVKDEKP